MCRNRYLFVLFVLILVPVFLNGQGQVTKERLLKLFYQAHSAKNANQTDAAIDAYIEILKLSPGLPEPYLQLGNLYSSMSTDAVALEKACICYANYLRLKPDAEGAEKLKSKVSEMTFNVQQLKGVGKLLALEQIHLDAVKPDLNRTERLMEKLSEIPIETIAQATVREQVDTVKSISDTIRVVSKDFGLPINDALLGRWVSDSLGVNGREIWIFDVTKKADDYYFSLNDSADAKKVNDVLKDIPESVQAFVDDDKLVVTYVIEQAIDVNNRNGRGGMLDNLLNSVKLKFDWVSDFSDGMNLDETKTFTDSVQPIAPVVLNSYQFCLGYDGFKLSGTVAHKVVKRDTVETLLSERIDNCELYKASDDYSGFLYIPVVSEAEKATKQELRQLLQRKLQEGMSSSSAINDLGCMYASGVGTRRNMKMAVAHFMEASMKQNLFGILNMAQLYVDGLGVEKDLEKARELYRQAFEQGYSDAMVMCGDTYLISASSDTDYKNAFDCYLKAVFRRCPYAYYRLGWLYMEGLGVVKDWQKAWEYYQKAVEMQYADAMVDVALFYKEGKMLERDINKTMELLMKAADKGNSRALYEMYQIFLKGEGDVKPNFKYAKDLYYKYVQANDKLIDGFNTVKSQINTILSPKR